jgi:glycerate kinase
VISRTVLVAAEPFGERLGGERVAAAIGRGLRAADASLEVDLLPLELRWADREAPRPRGPRQRRAAASERHSGAAAHVRTALDALGFDGRMRAARAVVLGAARLDERTLLGSATFELATRARQAGVPAYAVTAENALGLFDARVLDLQVILQAGEARALRRAGERLAGLV